jgi:predicted NUDIX family NTP pyrophosphohydrolase
MTTMPRRSAGLLMYRIKDGVLQVLLAHPGGPHFVKKDEGAWTIPKGEPGAITCNTFERTGVRGK